MNDGGILGTFVQTQISTLQISICDHITLTLLPACWKEKENPFAL